MDARLQRRIQRYGWDKAAAHYEAAWRQQLAPAQRALMRRAALRPGARVLDVACGTGLVTFEAAEAVGPAGAVTGIDISDSMVTLARAEALARGLSHVHFARMDAEALDFPSSSFDIVLCALGLMYVPDAALALREMARVLAPGGRIVCAVWGARRQCGWAEIFPIVDAQVKSEVCPLFFALGTGGLLGATVERAGLEDIQTERVSARLEWETADEACGAAFAGGPVALAYSRFDDATRLAARDAYLASIDQWREGAGYAVPGEFVVVEGRKAFDAPATVPRAEGAGPA